MFLFLITSYQGWRVKERKHLQLGHKSYNLTKVQSISTACIIGVVAIGHQIVVT